jgi:hypothetical protein
MRSRRERERVAAGFAGPAAPVVLPDVPLSGGAEPPDGMARDAEFGSELGGASSSFDRARH